MEVGLGVNGLYDCSGIVADSLRQLLGWKRGDWPPELRHTRQMVARLLDAGEVERPLAGATPRDIGSLVFSRILHPLPTLPVEVYGPAPPRIVHVSVLDGFTADGQPLIIESAGSEGVVLRREPPEPTQPLERVLFSSLALARLALDVAEQSAPEPALLAVA